MNSVVTSCVYVKYLVISVYNFRFAPNLSNLITQHICEKLLNINIQFYVTKQQRKRKKDRKCETLRNV